MQLNLTIFLHDVSTKYHLYIATHNCDLSDTVLRFHETLFVLNLSYNLQEISGDTNDFCLRHYLI